MTINWSPYPAQIFEIKYMDAPRNAVPVRARAHRLRRALAVMVAAATLLVAAIGFAQAAPIAPTGASDDGPVRGEFRLGLGLQQPPGYVVPLGKSQAGGDAQWTPSLIPDQGGVSLVAPKKGELIVAPKPPGRVPTV